MAKRQRSNIRYYINTNSVKGDQNDNRLWIISIPANQMKPLKHASEAKGIALKQITKADSLKLKGPVRRMIIDQHWSLARASDTFYVPADEPQFVVPAQFGLPPKLST